jgi:hypothetical protein
MKIILDGIYSKHIYFFCKLLKEENQIIEIKNFKHFDIYDNIIKKVIQETGYYLTNDILKNMINETTINKTDITKTEDILIIDCNRDIHDLESKIFKILFPNISPNPFDPKTIEHTINIKFNRNMTSKELTYHMHNNKNLDIFTWMMILTFCREGINNKPYDTKLIKNKKIAVILCGHVRNYRYTIHSQKRFIDNDLFDVFIHTWDDTGLKNDKRNIAYEWLNSNCEKIDIASIKQHYKPKKIKVENNKELLPKLSLRGKINPIFLFKYQAQDDATKYINSQLYSIYQAYKLIEEYELENNMKYDGIIKLRFDFNISHIDIDTIIRHISDTNAIYWPHAKSSNHFHRLSSGKLSGGCLSCDANIEHDEHTNDICDVWFYTKRILAKKVCEIFLHGEELLKNNQEHNLRMLKEHSEIKHEKKEDYIYISEFHDIDKYIRAWYPESINRWNLKGILCPSSMAIQGKIY